MRYTGRDAVREYESADNLRQEPGPEPHWQDSTWLQWWDLERGVGGVHRIGHQYNVDGGPRVINWSNLVTPAGIFKKVTDLPLRAEDKLEHGWGCGDDTCRSEVFDGRHVWTVDDPGTGVSASLTFTDYHDGFLGFPTAGRTASDITAHHIDVSGPVTGTITVPGGTFEVDGMGLRDHGWGHRVLGTMLSHRYVTGCFGPDLSFCAYAIHNGVSDTIETFAWVVRDEEVIFAVDVDILVYAEVDSASTRGGRIVLSLADGEQLSCELTAVAPGLLNEVSGFLNINTLCRATLDDGRVGTGHVETSMNFRYGDRRPERMQHGLIANGFHAIGGESLVGRDDGPFIPKHVL
ncbi:MAG: hypothetical protein JWO02_569 [Solirubrobacterales bacterium]|nr:hypothetical protein [Solirubrobacterales bacterium]